MKFATYVMTFDQEKWIMRNIENAYPHVDRIYVMHSERPWGHNPQARSLYKNTFDINVIKTSKFIDKIYIINGDWLTDTDQRNHCLQQAKHDGFDYLMVQDADEFFFHKDFEKIIQTVKDNPHIDVFAINLYAFWKSFKYVILSNENGRIGGTNQTIVNLHTVNKYDYIRNVNSGNHMTIPDVICYHGSYVLNDEQVYKKIKTWGHTSDFDTDKWYNDKWLNWTIETKDLHPIWPYVWPNCEIFNDPLPEVIEDLKDSYVTADIINNIIQKFAFNSYLEIGVGNPDNTFNKINVPLKHGIDPEGNATYTMTSDEFFQNHIGDNKYDVIFVDGFHSEEQAYRDVINAMNHLNKNGVILMHDCNPPTEKHAVEFKDYVKGAWNGTAYKAFLRIKKEYSKLSCFTIDNDWGYGVITERHILPNIILKYNDLSWKFFAENRTQLLQLISLKEFNTILEHIIITMRKNDNEKQGIIDLCKEFPENVIMAEVGSYAGESTLLFMNSGKVKQLYAIDPWQSGYDDSDLASSSNFDVVENAFDIRVKGLNVIKIKDAFLNVQEQLPLFDVIYIDGNHRYESVKKDLQLALTKIKPGGIICGHDYHNYSIDTVVKAIHEVLGHPHKIFSDYSWMIKI